MAGGASVSTMVAIVKATKVRDGDIPGAMKQARHFIRQHPRAASPWELRELCYICQHDLAAGDERKQVRFQRLAEACFDRQQVLQS